jgi:hypothetical protein
MTGHPYTWIARESQRWVFAVWAAFAVVVMVALQMLGTPLQNPAAPLGIISFEFAGTLGRAQEIVASWGPTGQVYAGLNLGLDYLFLVIYAASTGLGCVLVARKLPQKAGWLRSLAVVLAWGLILAACLDSVENYALIRVLLGSRSEFWPALARLAAIPKFLLVGAGLLYLASGGIWVFVRWLGSRETYSG